MPYEEKLFKKREDALRYVRKHRIPTNRVMWREDKKRWWTVRLLRRKPRRTRRVSFGFGF